MDPRCSVFLMCYPSRDWHIVGGENFRSRARSNTSPREAMREWLELADEIERAGGTVVVMDPPEAALPLTGLPYAANFGLHVGARDYLLANMSATAHRTAEAVHVKEFLVKELSFTVVDMPVPWEGKADVCPLADGIVILTAGPRTVSSSAGIVAGRVSADVSEVMITDHDFFHGDTCLDPFVTPSGERILLRYAGAFASKDLLTTSEAAEEASYRIYPVGHQDALEYACNTLQVGSTLLTVNGVSMTFILDMQVLGFDVRDQMYRELFGKGGGGPVCLVNPLYFLRPDEVSAHVCYRSRRDELYELGNSYPPYLV